MAVSVLRIFFVVVIFAFSTNGVSPGKCKKNMRVTEAFREKWMHLFNIMDIDKDGIVTREECWTMTLAEIDMFHPTVDLLHGLMSYCLFVNDVLESFYGVNTTKAGQTLSEFLMSNECYWSNNFDLVKLRVRVFFTALFHAMDGNKDGFVGIEELQRHYTIFNEDDEIREIARKAFNTLDVNGNGKIEEGEFVDTYVNFLVDPDFTRQKLPMF